MKKYPFDDKRRLLFQESTSRCVTVSESTIETTFEYYLHLRRFMEEQKSDWHIQIIRLDYRPLFGLVTVKELKISK